MKTYYYSKSTMEAEYTIWKILPPTEFDLKDKWIS